MHKIDRDNKEKRVMGKPKKVVKKRKRSIGVDNEIKEVILDTTTRSTLVVDDGIACDILSRLPVKSLMRFKCVSKHWSSLIKEPYFIDLHLRTTKPPARLLFLLQEPKFLTKNKTAGIKYQDVRFQAADLLSEVTGRAVPTIHTIRTSEWFQCSDILGAINSLLCFTNKLEDSVCIYNIGTREVMPLIKSTLRENDTLGTRGVIYNSVVYSFGFDPATNQYKVIRNWIVYKGDRKRNVWEVLTLGNNLWKRIKEVRTLADGLSSSSIYVNGTVYWLPDWLETGNWKEPGNTMCIMAFDVGTEKFRDIRIPQFIVDHPKEPVFTYPRLKGREPLLEVNGCLAILRRTSEPVVKLWIHEGDDNGIGVESWKEQTITLPGCLYKSHLATDFSFHCIAGTDRLLLEIHQTDSDGNKRLMSLFTFDWQDETFKQMKISGIPSSARICTSFVESLISFPEANQPISTFKRIK